VIIIRYNLLMLQKIHFSYNKRAIKKKSTKLKGLKQLEIKEDIIYKIQRMNDPLLEILM